MFEEEISPEELFSRFFSGGFGAGPFGMLLSSFSCGVRLLVLILTTVGGPQFVFNMGGGPGFRVHQFGGARPRRRPREPQPEQPPLSAWDVIRQFLPLFLLFIIPLLSSFLSSSSSAAAGPSFRFDAAVPPHIMQRTTPRLNVNYYVSPTDVEDFTSRKFQQLDQRVEVDYVNKLRYECDNEERIQSRMIQDAQGWFFPDVDKLREARTMKKKSCRKLDQVRARY